MSLKILVYLLVAVLIFGCTSNYGSRSSFDVVENFDANLYKGKWYEIARTYNRFQKNCIDSSAFYDLNSDNTISVVNTCLNINDNSVKSVKGKAKFVKEENIGHLKVSFFWPFYGDYNIVYLSEDYSYAIVMGSSKKYCWILSRYPIVEPDTLSMLIKKVNEFGIKTDELIINRNKV